MADPAGRAGQGGGPQARPTTETRATVVQARTLELYDQLGLGLEALPWGRHAAGLCLWKGGGARASADLRGLGAALIPHPNIFQGMNTGR